MGDTWNREMHTGLPEVMESNGRMHTLASLQTQVISTLSLAKKAMMHRLVYDKGWHGGNRAKSVKPDDAEIGEWIGCGDCGQPDSQHHWIRECAAEPHRSTRNQTLDSVNTQIYDIWTGKGGNSERSQELRLTRNAVVHHATYEPVGEQLWLGILPQTLIDNIEHRVSTTI